MRQRYRRRPDQPVTAVRLDLEFDGFEFRKWGETQRARPGDWLVDNAGEVYTVAADTFSRTYREVGPGRWVKHGDVWAEQAAEAGAVSTQEGRTHYAAGDWIVSNQADGSDGYAIEADKFAELYEPAPAGD